MNTNRSKVSMQSESLSDDTPRSIREKKQSNNFDVPLYKK